MCSAGAAAGGQGAAGAMNAYSQYQQGKMNEQYYEHLAKQTSKQIKEVDISTQENLSMINAEAARDTAKVKQAGKQTTSAQRAAMAANGIYSDSGSFSDIISDAIDKQALDEAAIKYNADLSMWQTKRNSINQKVELYAQETSQRVQGSNARSAGSINAASTLVGSAAASANTYSQLKNKK